MQRKDGLSLVEVTLSLAIVSFAFTTLLALLPIGLHIFRDGISTTVKAQISSTTKPTYACDADWSDSKTPCHTHKPYLLKAELHFH